jgi:2-haloalkanoic acid dehalogenase type II
MFDSIRAVAFDLDNTLWDVMPVIERAEQVLHEWMREHCPRIPERFTIETMRAARLRLARQEPHRAHDLAYLRLATLTWHARECGYDDEMAKRAYEIFFAARNEVALFPDVRPALEALGSRYELATLTNGNADLGRIGLANLFTVSLNARGVGAAKPDRRCFTRLVGELGLEPHEVLYVGDDPVCDIEGARAAGLRTAWILTVRDCAELASAARVG